MTKPENPNKSKFPPRTFLITVLITVLLTLILAGFGAWLLGFLTFGGEKQTGTASSDNAGKKDRKVAYWRAPMNPTEIYDKPGKSAMGMDLVPVYEDDPAGGGTGGQSERKIAYWRAPMNPTEVYDKPGKSAMGMDLVPVYEDELIGGVEISVDPVVTQNMGLRTARVEKQPLARTIRTYGHVTADETLTVRVSTKVDGWVEKLYVDFTGKFVEKGDPLFEIYSPDLMAAQEEFLVAMRSHSGQMQGAGSSFPESARRRLLYFDVPEAEIENISKSGKPKKTLLITSPSSGFVLERNIEEGGFVKTGTTIFRITDLTRVWVDAHIFEYELPWISEGMKAEMSLPYLPGDVFKGRVSFVYPYLQPKTRDVIIRLEFENSELKLKPDMYADVRLKIDSDAEGTVVPSEAVIRSGERNVVFVEREPGKFTPRDVTLGVEVDGGKLQILAGLAPGEVIVTSGQFLLDSESKLKEAVQKMLEVKRAEVKPQESPAGKPEPADDFFDELETKKKVGADEDFFKDLEKEQ